MKLKNQVCSIKLARKLKELGVKQKSLYYWAVEMDKGRETRKWSLTRAEHLLPSHPKVSAFTVAESGEMLPSFWVTWKGKSGKKWYGGNIPWKEKLIEQEFCNHGTEANARAKVLVYLIKNKLKEEK